MSVRLIAITRPVTDECETTSELLAYVARVSNPANQANHLTARKLLKYLKDHDHWSPFEMASMTLEITTTRDIARQILRHRSFSFQEFSQRYAEVTAPPVLREARLQDEKNRQNSTPTEDQNLQDWWEVMQRDVASIADLAYQTALSKGIAKEVARSVLPEGMTESKIYMAGTIRSWIHYVALRGGNGTQKEHRDIAVACGDILWGEFPSLQEILEDRS